MALRRNNQIRQIVVLILVGLRIAVVIAALLTIPAVAQEQAPQPLPEPRNVQTLSLQDAQRALEGEVPEPPDPPSGRNAWSLRVHTTGGFTGQGIGSVTISSNGQVGCGPAAPCATSMTTASLNAVRMALGSIVEAAWIRSPTGFCSDCIRTAITLKRREGGVVRTFVATWDDSQAPAPGLRELRRLAFELRATLSAQR